MYDLSSLEIDFGAHAFLSHIIVCSSSANKHFMCMQSSTLHSAQRSSGSVVK